MLLRPKTHAAEAVAPSLLRMGLQASPRGAPAARHFTERPLLLQQRVPSTQLSLFGPGGSR